MIEGVEVTTAVKLLELGEIKRPLGKANHLKFPSGRQRIEIYLHPDDTTERILIDVTDPLFQEILQKYDLESMHVEFKFKEKP